MALLGMEDKSGIGAAYVQILCTHAFDEVDFDSVFNQSSHTFSFGSPDILPMFSHGATLGKVNTWCYDEEEEDFTKGRKLRLSNLHTVDSCAVKDATVLDTWVLDQLRTLFWNATVDPTLDSKLRSDKVVFFLHLLGLDVTGHAYRPHSQVCPISSLSIPFQQYPHTGIHA